VTAKQDQSNLKIQAQTPASKFLADHTKMECKKAPFVLPFTLSFNGSPYNHQKEPAERKGNAHSFPVSR
jgi:hypothetical protein